MLQVQESLAEIGGLQDEWRDNLNFLSWEFMLNGIAVLINAEVFSQATLLLEPEFLLIPTAYRVPC